ncbi:hypothetical protein H2199_008333 [Coniosporium tulheliwenetii]|uniref:Uncharacterized protein n=1 Tax=Coniosporium tulheliwenetii TaxID=3383036 RepID=A0ACC2YKU2_9PEZI|nr:hypothetical protein H2199_008333 [Cladosporium sp. JES 115]
MSRAGGFRASAGDLGFFEEPPRRAATERWDRDKFERISRLAQDERDAFRFDDRDRFAPPARRREVEVEFDERREVRGPRGRFEERDRFFEEDRFARAPRRPEFLDEPLAAEVASRALAPYRRKSVVERDDFDAPVETAGSLWRGLATPVNVDIPLPIRREQSRRRRSPPRDRYREHDFEEIRYRDVEPDRDEEYRDVRIHREKSRTRRSRSVRAASRRSSSSSSSSFEEIEPVREKVKRGKTRMPKRLVDKQAVIQCGYPFEEEDDFIVVRRALQKEQIDEIIKISETYKKENNRTTYRYEETTKFDVPPPPPPQPDFFAPPPPPPPEFFAPPPPPPPPAPVPVEQVIRTEYVQPAPPPPPPAPPSMYYPAPQSVRSASPGPRREREREVYEERVEESNHIGGPLTIVLPERNRRSDRDIKREIASLEAERRAVKLEREAEEKRQQALIIRERDDYEVIESSGSVGGAAAGRGIGMW